MKKSIIVFVAVAGLALTFGCQKQSKPQVAGGDKIKGMEKIHFDFDKSDIKPEFKKVLDNNAKYLKEHEKTNATIEGHCDERGTEEYNIALGHRRAGSARDYIVSLGVDGKRLKTKSLGEEQALETCHNESCWWKNRRAEFTK